MAAAQDIIGGVEEDLLIDFDEELLEINFNNERISERVDDEEDNEDLMDIDEETSPEWIVDSNNLPNNWLPKFQARRGPKILISDKPEELFVYFFSPEFLAEVLKYTNEHGVSKKSDFRELSMNELNTFIGIQGMMGIKKLSEEKKHWSKKDKLFESTPIKEAMSRDRYLETKSAFRFYSPSSTATDKLKKVRLLVNQLPIVSQRLYQPGKQLSVDESLVGCSARFSDLQYIPSKAHKWGLKFFCLCEPSTGFLINWMCFSDAKRFNENYTENIVLSLLDIIPDHSGHEIYTDNFYSNVSTAFKLAERGMGFCGTFRQNRKELPIEFKKPNNPVNRKNPGALFMRRGKLCVVSWFDQKLVIAGSTHIGNQIVNVDRTVYAEVDGQSVANKVIVRKPKIIAEYTKYMNGVDVFDHKLQFEAYSHRFNNYVHAFWHLYRHASFNNMFHIFKCANPNIKMTSKNFRRYICDWLVSFTTKSKPTTSITPSVMTTVKCIRATLVPFEKDHYFFHKNNQ